MKHFYVGVKAVIRRDEKILLVKSAEKGFWDVPGGRIDDEEALDEALKRELREELPSFKNSSMGRLITAFRVPGSIAGDVGLVLLFYEVSGEFKEGIVLSDEHTEYQWADYDKALAEASDGVQAAVQVLIRESA